MIIKKSLKITFSVGSGVRADSIDKKLLERMRAAGLIKISLGIESTDSEVLKGMKKSLRDPERVKELCEYAHELGISTKGFFIVGAPKDNFEKVKKSMEFAKQLKLTAIAVSMMTPLPGTQLWNWVKENGTFLEDPSEYIDKHTLQPDDVAVPFETKDFTREERIKAYRYTLKVKRSIEGSTRKRLLWITKRVFGVMNKR